MKEKKTEGTQGYQRFRDEKNCCSDYPNRLHRMDQYKSREKKNVKWHVGKIFSGPGGG